MLFIKNILVVGSLNMDFVIDVKKMPQPGETLLAKSFSLVPGGKGANKAFAIGKLGCKNVTMFGAVGCDEYGKNLINNLNSVNVNTDNILKLNNVNTGCAFIHVDETGENSITVVSGANAKITEEMINKNISLIKNADIVVLQLEIPLEVNILVAKIAKQYGKLVILDPAPADANLSEELLKNVDIIKPNETEIQILTGIESNEEKDIVNAAYTLINKGVKNVIVTLGSNGSILVNKEKVEHFSCLDVNVIDSTAAGDSFIAALSKSLLEGNTLEESIEYAHIVSSIVVTKKGAQTSIPSQEEIEAFLQERNRK